MTTPVIAVPLKPFREGKGRLADHLEPSRRALLAEMVATRVVIEALETGAPVIVVTGDDEVAAWARRSGAHALGDPGGLDAAASAAAAYAATLDVPWLVAHGDLPLLRADELRLALVHLGDGDAVLAPSRHGGTNLLGAGEPILFRYGADSFSRHLASTRHLRQRVLVSVATLLDLDTPPDLAAAVDHPRGAWLTEYLG